MKLKSSGHSVLELLVALLVSSVLSVIGIEMIQTLINSSVNQQLRDADNMTNQSIIDRFQYAFDRRLQNPFSPDPWLKITAGSGSRWYPLSNMEILIVENDETYWWKWTGSTNTRINVNIPEGVYYTGKYPEKIAFQFPDSVIPGFRDGIAIEGL